MKNKKKPPLIITGKEILGFFIYYYFCFNGFLSRFLELEKVELIFWDWNCGWAWEMICLVDSKSQI